jgi:signal transduction histidine kinase/ligand-binding sensor domain-containing protein
MVYQDRKGFVWIATDNGVVKYDGKEFVTYNRTNGLTDNTVFGFHEDQKGRIWFRTFSGLLSYYENDTIRPYKFNDVLEKNVAPGVLSDIYFDSLSQLHFGTTVHVSRGKIDSLGKLTMFREQKESVGLIDLDGNKMFAGRSGAAMYIKKIYIQGKEFNISLDEPNDQSQSLIACVKWRGKMYFCIHKNIFVYDGETVTKLFTAQHALISLYVDHEDRLWTGYFNNGVNIFNDETLQHPISLKTLTKLSVTSVIQDYENGFWISTLDQGVFYFPNLTIQNYYPPNDIRVSAIGYAGNEVYLGNYGGEVFRMNQKGVMQKINQGVAPISSLFIDSERKLWISDGYATMIHGKGHYVKGLNSSTATSFKDLAQRRDTIFGCNSLGIFKLSIDGKIIQKLDTRKRPTSMVILGHDVYLGGLYGVDKYSLDFRGEGTRIANTRVNSMISLDDNFVVIGTAGNGLMVYDTKQQLLTSLPVSQFMSVYSIICDASNRRLWIGTDQGLFQLQFVKDTSALVLGELSKADGLTSNKINRVCRIGDNIWAATDLGISSVPLGHFKEQKFPPRFYINRILFKNGSVTPNPTSVSTTEEDMVVDVRPITFKGHPTFFRYRLGNGQSWKMVSNGNIFLTDLRPGEYKMELQASSGSDHWTKSDTLQITVLARWWETWTFRCGVIVALILLGYVAYRLRMSALSRRQKYLELINLHQQKLIDSEIRTQERERKRIATDLHDGIGATLSSIKLQIAGVVNEDADLVSNRAKEINDNLADVIDDIKRIVYDLHPPGLERYGLQAGLKSLVDRLNKTSDVNVIFDYYGQRDIMQPVSITIFRIVQELINNTLKHARATEIRIHINEFEEEINVMYEDNGIGMVGSRFPGLGLHSIESRVRSLNGRMTWESNHKGTFYNFDIPL